MATYEKNGQLTYKDAEGNSLLLFPKTKIPQVDGLEEVLDGKAPVSHANSRNNPHKVTADQVGAVSTDLLWTNASVNSDFAAQTISLDLSDYTHIMVDFAWTDAAVTFRKGQKFYSNRTLLTSTSSNAIVIDMYKRDITASDSGITFTDAAFTRYTKSSNTFADLGTSNNALKPIRIFGLKGVV